MYTDIHSHVIWGVDDGAETKEETFLMLREAAEDGIDRIICTPHVTPGVYEFPMERFLENFAEATEYIRKEGLPLQLFHGAELLWTEMTPRLLRERQVATMAGTSYAMIEFSPTDRQDKIFDALQKVARAGFIPIIAHMERYPAIREIEQVQEMKSRFRAMVQINARSLTRKQPFFRRGFFDRLFKEGMADFVATDTHSMPGRETCMRAGMTALKEKYGEIVERRIREMPQILFE